MKHFFFQHKAWLWPLLLVLIITPFTPAIDLAIERLFYQGNGAFAPNYIYYFMYHYGIIPGFIVAGLALTLWISSFFFKRLKKHRSIACICAFTLVIGSGLITHLLLKDHYGRPRPKQVTEFGGNQTFRPFYYPDFNLYKEPSKSFPCGHCTMGFYFFSFLTIGIQLNKKWLIWVGLILAFGLGGLLSLTRMAQGGHFFSDTLISALIMWLTALSLTSITIKASKVRQDERINR